jgi:hypothetical protein
MTARLAVLLLPLAMLAGCGPPENAPRGIFVRDVPDVEPPIRPAPTLADVRPVPDLHSDEKALAILCAVTGGESDAVCACMARTGAAEFRGRDLAYFTALLIGDEAEAARLQRELTQEDGIELGRAAEAVARQCGAL